MKWTQNVKLQVYWTYPVRSQRLLRVFRNAEMLSMVLDILKQIVDVMKTVAMSKWMSHVKLKGKEVS